MKITPDTKLEIGTMVRVKNMVGFVKTVDYVQAIPVGMIYVHTIDFAFKESMYRNADGTKSIKRKSIPTVTKSVNYSFIEVL